MDDIKPNPQIEKVRRELHRKSLDSIVVYNPLEDDFTVVWDKFRHIIPAKSERAFPRYIAMKYIREITDKLIYNEEADKVADANDKRNDRGMPPLTPQERDQYALQYGLTTANEEKRKEIFKTVYVGIGEEYGVDTSAGEVKREKKDTRTFEERMLDEMEKDAPPAKVKAVITEQDTKIKKEALVKEASSGKEDKKDNRKS